MPVRVVKGKQRLPKRTSRDVVTGFFLLNNETGLLIAVVNAGRLRRGRFYNGFVSDRRAIALPGHGRFKAAMPQNLFNYRSNVEFSPEKAQEYAPTERGVAFVVIFASQEEAEAADTRTKAALTLQAAIRGFLTRCSQRRQTESAVCIQRAVRHFLAVKAGEGCC